jgi:hypothetical protein
MLVAIPLYSYAQYISAGKKGNQGELKKDAESIKII